MAARRFFVAAAAALLVAAPAFGATAVNPRVKPTTGHRGTTFRVAFTAPKAAGRQGVTERSYSVELTVRARGCSQSSVQTVPNAKAGQRVKMRFRPPSGHWCLGKGRGTISMSEGPYCQAGQPCPAFPSTTREIAHFSFKVVKRP
jgi:hypothetical protein